MHPRSTNVLGGSAHAEVTGVDIHCRSLWNITRHNCTLVEMQVFHFVDNACNVVRILRYRFAVFTSLVIGNVHSSTCSTEIRIGAPWLHVVLRILRIQREITSSNFKCVLNQRTWKQQTAVFIKLATLWQEVLKRGWNGIGNTDVFQNIDCSLMNLQHFRVG